MTPEEFIAKWRGSELTERAAAQSHFNDLCELLGVPRPTPASAPDYAFEKATRSIFCINRDDYVSLGILASRIHEIWSTAQGNRLGAGNQRRYNIGVTFETFPFPEGLTPNIPAAEYAGDPRAVVIAEAALRLDELREASLNPADLVRREPEVVPGYPDRILPRNPEAAAILKKRTLTNLYNQRPASFGPGGRNLTSCLFVPISVAS